MRFVTVTAALLCLTGACYHGPSLAKFGPAQGPKGISASLELSRTTIHAELLAVQDSALVILTDSNRVALVAVSTIRVGRFDRLGDVIVEGVDARETLARLRNFSRFPAGLTPELRARLLAAYGQTTYDVAQ